MNSGKVYAAGLDVVSSEPIKADNPLLRAKNCLITPHISWAPRESRQRLMDAAVNNLARFLAGATGKCGELGCLYPCIRFIFKFIAFDLIKMSGYITLTAGRTGV